MSARSSGAPPAPDDEDERPSGIPDEASRARRVSFRPPKKSDPPAPGGEETPEAKRPRGLKHITESVRLKLQLALDHDDEDPPPGLPHITTSARRRLELALEHDPDDDVIPPPSLRPSALADPTVIPLDDEGRAVLRSLTRWVAFTGFVTAAVGALTGPSYFTGTGTIVHVVVGILASALSIWLLAAAWQFRRMATKGQKRHLLVNGLGLLRTALLLKAILVFSAMVLGCFGFSIAAGILFVS